MSNLPDTNLYTGFKSINHPCRYCTITILLCLLMPALLSSVLHAQNIIPKKTRSGIYIQSNSLEFKTRKELIAIVRELRDANIDEIYVEALTLGEAYFRSPLVPSANRMDKSAPDPLIVILTEAHANESRPIKVFAVIKPLMVFDGHAPLAPPASHLYRSQPEWLTTTNLGRTADPSKEAWLDPGIPEVRAYVTKTVQSLCRDYPLDGIHFAQMRYPGLDRKRGYSKKALKAYAESKAFDFRPEPEDADWIDWRTSQLTEMLKSMAQAAREARPGIIISASGLAESTPPKEDNPDPPAYMMAMQNWPDWCESGIIDQLVLENFHSHKKNRADFLLWIYHAQKTVSHGQMLIGVSGPKNYDSDVVAQIRQIFARRMDGAVLYTYSTPARDPAPGSNLLGFLGNTLFSPDYVVPRYALNEIQSSVIGETVELPDNDMPPPIPLAVVDNKKPTTTKKTPSEVDVTRALLGLDDDEPIGVTQTTSYIEDIRQKPIPQEVKIPKISGGETGLGIYEIILSNDMRLEANIIEERPDGSLFIKLAGRLGGGTQLDLPASRIKSYKPLKNN